MGIVLHEEKEKLIVLIKKFFSIDNEYMISQTNDFSKQYIEVIQNCQTLTGLFGQLATLFSDIKEKIDEQDNLNNYHTDGYKNIAIQFSKEVLPIVLDMEKQVEDSQKYFINILETNFISLPIYRYKADQYPLEPVDLSVIFDNPIYEKTSYLSLASFFKETMLRFRNNEEAIHLLCRYFPENNEFAEEDQEKIAQVIQWHCTFCGTRKDLGYAYDGIEKIKKYIGYLPKIIVEKVIRRYNVGRVISNEVQRNQLFTIISSHKEIENNNKFNYIDASILMDKLANRQIYGKFGIGLYTFNDISYRFGDLKVEIDESYYWKIEGQRFTLYEEKEEVVNFELVDEAIIVNDKPELKMDYSFEDWKLSDVKNKMFYEELDKEFERGANGHIEEKIIVSYLYLKKYKGLKNEVSVPFNNEYVYNFTDGELISRKNKLPFFYGQNITSLTAIVGQNGVGKSTILSFMKDDLIKLLIDIETNNKLVDENGLVEHKVEGNPEAEFILIFSYKNENYILSNLNEIKLEKTENLKSYQPGMLKQIEHFVRIYNFSNAVNIYNNHELNHKQDEISEFNLYTDYSEQAELTKPKMKDLSVPLVTRVVANFFKIIANWKEECQTQGSPKNDFSRVVKKIDVYYTRVIQQIVPDFKEIEEQHVQILYEKLSSGELSKLIFLSKFVWSISKHEEEGNKLDELYPKMENNEPAIILIDEGELYYHPEWQREFLSILLAFLNHETNKKVQLILATNSPFVLSDIVSSDIVYLPKNQKSKLTFGQNIHTLLSEDFFMEFTIGEFSRGIIDRLLNILSLDFLTPIKSLQRKIEVSDIDSDFLKRIVAALKTVIRENQEDIEETTAQEVAAYLNKVIEISGYDQIETITSQQLTQKRLLDKLKNIVPDETKWSVESVHVSVEDRSSLTQSYKKIAWLVFKRKIDRLLPFIDEEHFWTDLSAVVSEVGENIYRMTLEEMLEQRILDFQKLTEYRLYLEYQKAEIQKKINDIDVGE